MTSHWRWWDVILAPDAHWIGNKEYTKEIKIIDLVSLSPLKTKYEIIFKMTLGELNDPKEQYIYIYIYIYIICLMMFVEGFTATTQHNASYNDSTPNFNVQTNCNGSNTFGTFKRCSRQGLFELVSVNHSARSGIILEIYFWFSLTWTHMLCVLIRIASLRRF